MVSMDGEFYKGGFRAVTNILGTVCGMIVALLGAVVCAAGSGTLDDVVIGGFFVFFGLLVFVICGVSLYVNRKAFIHVDEEKISAFCHYGLRLRCKLTDVGNVSYGGEGLSLRLKNGRKYNLMHMKNPFQVGKYIQKRISAQPAALADKKTMLAAIASLRKKRHAEGIASPVGFLLLIPGTFLASGLTGWRELHEFSARDWQVFAVMAGLGVAVAAVSSVLLCKCLLHTEKLHELQGTLYQNILRTAPPLPGNVIKLFIDDEVRAYYRLTVYGYPNSDEVYYTVESVDQNYEIACTYTSKVYANFAELEPIISNMTEIAIP